MNEQKETQFPSKEDDVALDGPEAGTDELSIFFGGLQIPPDSITAYKDKLAKFGLNDVVALRKQTSISFLLEQVGIKPEHIDRVIRKLYDAHDVLEYAPHSSQRALRSFKPAACGFLSKENVVILREIGHGASGRVFKALFVPTLTLIVIKYVEVKGAIEQRIVAQELNSLYQVAMCEDIGDLSGGSHSPYLICFYGAVSSACI